MKILLASSEVHPFSKTGGLADMAGALARVLARAGNEVRVVSPLYRGIRKRFPETRKTGLRFRLPMGADWMEAELWELEPGRGLKFQFIHHPGFFDRDGIYQEGSAIYKDNAERFILFSKCVAQLAREPGWRPDIVHLHDWQTALVPALLRAQAGEGQGGAPPTCLTLHNLAYQGVFPADIFPLTNLPGKYFQMEGMEFYGQVNFLKAGIVYADRITTVSPRYAREILTEPLGCGLDGVLRQRRDALTGILNGVDYADWNTTRNPHLFSPYSATRMAGKRANKLGLQKLLGLPEDESVPLFGTISRLVEQKGVDIQLATLAEMLASPMQFVLLGSGEHDYERGYRELARHFPGKVALRFGYDEELAHRIEAGCDFFLMPSRFEPCGLNQMYSQRYGTVPIVRATGGLDDSVVDWTENAPNANGIKFQEYSARALAKAVRKALALYQRPELLQICRRNAMRADFSWDKTVDKYLEVYQQCQQHH